MRVRRQKSHDPAEHEGCQAERAPEVKRVAAVRLLLLLSAHDLLPHLVQRATIANHQRGLGAGPGRIARGLAALGGLGGSGGCSVMTTLRDSSDTLARGWGA